MKEKKPRGFETNTILSVFSPNFPFPMATLLGFFFIFAAAVQVSATPASSTAVSFTPQDNYLIDCGSNSQTTHSNGRLFPSAHSSVKYFSSNGRKILASVPSANVPSLARIIVEQATYTFHISRPGWHRIRLHFFPLKTPEFNLKHAKFTLTTEIPPSLNDLYFNVFINRKTAISGIDLSTLTSGLATPYYKDFVVNSLMVSTPLSIQIGPWTQGTGSIYALLNGIEVLKMNNSVNSLDGEFDVDGKAAA